MSEKKNDPATVGVRDKQDPQDNPIATVRELGRLHRGRPSTGQPELEGIDFAREDFPAHPTVNTK